MTLFLYRPENGDIPGVSKVARAYRMPVEEISDRSLYPTLLDAKERFPDVPWIGLEVTTTSVPLEDFDWPQYANAIFITGSMNRGLTPEVLAQLDGTVKVEQFDDAGWLSPVSAVSIFLYERFKHLVGKEFRV